MPIPSSYTDMIDAHLREMGQLVALPAKFVGEAPPKKPKMVPALFVGPATWVIPVKLLAGENGGYFDKGKMGRNKTVKESIYRALGPHWAIWGPFGDRVRAGQNCSIRSIRLGGRGLDVANLWSAMKFAEDAIANLLGCSDGMPAWKRAFAVDQEPGEAYGLRIEMRSPPDEPLPSSKRSGRAVRK